MKTSLLLSLALSLPLFAAGRPLAEPKLAPTTYGTHRSATAFAGDRFLTVWTELMGGMGRHFKGVWSDTSGNRISPASFTLVRDVNPEWTELAGTGDGYALFWREQNVTRMASIDLHGNVTATRVLDLPNFVGADARLAWNGSRFLVVLKRVNPAAHDAEGLLLDRDGTVVRRNIAIEDVSYFYAIVPEADGFAVFASGNDLVAHRVTNEGAATATLVEGATGPSTTSFRPQRVIATGLGNGDVLLAWVTSNFEQSEIRTALFTADGTVTPRHVAVTGNVTLTPGALHRTNGGAVLVYTVAHAFDLPATLYTLRLDATGAPEGGPAPESGPTAGPAPAAVSDAASNGNITLIAGNFHDTLSLPRVSSIAVDADGTPDEPVLLSIGPARQMQPALTMAGQRLLAAWTDLEGDAASLRTAQVANDGRPIVTAVAGASFLAADEMAWNGTDALIVTHAHGKVWGTRVTSAGAPVAAPVLLGNYPYLHYLERRAAVTWAGDRWLVIWPEQDAVRMVTLSASGAVTATRLVPLLPALPPNHFRYVEAAEIAFDGRHILLVFGEVHGEICFFPVCNNEQRAAWAVRLTAAGDPAGTPLLLPSLSNADDFSIAASGGEFVILGGPHAVTVDAPAEELRLLNSRDFFRGASDVTWDGKDFVIALRYQLARTHLALYRVDWRLEDVAAPKGIETLPAFALRAPSIAAVDSQRTIIAVEEGDAESGARAVVYLEQDMRPLAAPRPPRNVRTQPVNGAYELTWDAPEGDVELYHVEGLSPTGWVWVAQVPAHVRSVRSQYAVNRVRAISAGGYSQFATEVTRRRAAGR